MVLFYRETYPNGQVTIIRHRPSPVVRAELFDFRW